MRSIALRLALVLALAASVGCGGDDGGGSGNGEELTADEVLQRSAERFEEVRSFHFRLEHENGRTRIPFNLELERAEGDVVLPDRLAADLRTKLGVLTIDAKVIAIGDRVWITNPFSRDFERLPGDVSISDVADPAALVSSVATNLRDAEMAGTESVGGVTTYHITGTIDSGDLAEGLAFADSGRTIRVDAWVGQEDYLLRRARLTGSLVPSEDDDIARIITFSEYGETVTIEEP